MFRSVYSRMLITYIMIAAFILLLQSVILVQLYKQSYSQMTADSTVEQAEQIAKIIASQHYSQPYSAPLVLSTLEAYETSSTNLWLVDENGIVFQANSEDKLHMNKKDLAESLEKVFNGETVVINREATSVASGLKMTVAVPVVFEDDSIRYAIYMYRAIDSTQGLDYMFYRHLLISTFITILVSGLLVLISSKHITLPIKQLNKMCIDISNGNFETHIHTSGHDEIEQLATSFNTMAQNLKRHETLRSSFVANVSHELRSPITSIHGFAKGLLDGTIDEKDRDKYAKVIVDESMRLKKLINELLDLSQIESGEFPLHLSQFDINEHIRRVLIRYIDRIEEKNIELKVSLSDDFCMVFADIDRIDQVIVNLIDNALKFTPEKGTISIWTKTDEEKVLVGVSDTGCGISKEDLDYIFERFFKSDKAHSNKIGSGLGLSIVKKILDQHGETIFVRSDPNQGTKFIFTLTSAKVN
ncbi:MAG: HAMP domain-containing histidine kinase [Clostridia bacterium]|nr:HAMP domain-containing histidine kinase [Clostridia bacterium]